MIRIIIELVPHGIENMSKEIGYMEIANDGTGSYDYGNYKFKLYGKNRYKMYKGEVKGFPRRRLTVWWLVYRCLCKYMR